MLFQPIKPMLLTMRREAFDDYNYIFEPKWDGWRIMIHKQGDRIEAYTRQGNCVTNKFPELQEAEQYIRAYSVVLDCEGICLRDGRPVFDDFTYRGRLRDRRKITSAVETHPATFVVFDVLYTDRDHTQEPLIERKARLADIITPSKIITPTLYMDGIGVRLKKMTEERNWEGIVAKRKDSIYRPDTRSYDWVKIKNWKEIDTVILGYRTKPQFGLIVGLHFPTMHNKPVATVEFGFKPEEKLAFLEVAKQIHTVKDRYAQWVEPRLCCRIKYLERTESHKLRIAVFESFLPGKDPSECRWIS